MHATGLTTLDWLYLLAYDSWPYQVQHFTDYLYTILGTYETQQLLIIGLSTRQFWEVALGRRYYKAKQTI